MPTLVNALELKGNPFEHYVAELEPDIADYAVKPPYFEAIGARAQNTSSFILFGDRGAGKSATRLTIFKELWKQKAKGQKVPFAVNMTDFSNNISGKQITNASESALIGETAFIVLESVLTWLSSLEESERTIYIGALDSDEKTLCYELIRDFYASRSEAKRQKSAREALILFNQAFLVKSKLWVEQRWEPIAKLLGNISDALLHNFTNVKESFGPEVTAAISSQDKSDFDSVLVMRKLVDLVKIFDFSGIVVLIDKVDETDATNNSVDKTAELIHPLLARVQLIEVTSFSWVFFLWQNVKNIFESEKYPVRLDKVGHASVAWSDQFFELMLDRRMEFFSDNRMKFSGLFQTVDLNRLRGTLLKISMRSPRELIRLMDVVIREHDVLHAAKPETVLLDEASIETGIDCYVTDRISSIYNERLLAQIFRLNKTTFSNKDVQLTFKVGAQSARTRIQSWESSGIIKLSGTRAAEGALGGKPANEYTIIDARIERIMQRQLISYQGEIVSDDPEFDPEMV